jgi:NAD(P)-dependent dehydrogenase (short-subunit alcohol dehydrogenase family)
MVLLVTGCRSGFGLLIAQTAGRAGHTVYAGLRDLSTADKLRAATEGLDVHPVALDVTSAEQRDAIVARILQEKGRLDALINNAGVGLGGFLELIERSELDRLMEVNFFGLWALTKAVLPTLRTQGSGLVLNITSMAGRSATPGLGAYAASKFAVEGMTEALRHEMRPHGVRVVLLEPGPYATDIFQRNRTEAARMEPAYQDQYDKLNALVEKVKMGDPQDIADLVLRLLTSPNPKLRYAMGPNTALRLALRTYTPWWFEEWFMARVLGF